MLVELAQLGHQSECEKDLEILSLDRQLAILERKLHLLVRLSHSEKLTMVVLAVRLKAKTDRIIKQFGEAIRIVKPGTVFRWHSELVRHKWTYRRQNH